MQSGFEFREPRPRRRVTAPVAPIVRRLTVALRRYALRPLGRTGRA